MTTADHAGDLIAPIEETRASVRIWVAVALTAFLLNLGAYVGFVTVGEPFFMISDALALLLAVSMVPVMVGLGKLLMEDQPRLSTVAKWIGIAGMILIGVGSLVLLTSEVSHEFVPAAGGLGMQFVGFALEGVWLILLSRLTRDSGIVSLRFSTLSLIAGGGFLLGSLAAPFGPETIPVALAALVSFVAFILWSVTLRRDLAPGG